MKTIFLSLSSSAVYRNLFFFPESFFVMAREQMSRDHDLRLVILMPSLFLKKYAPLLLDPALEGRLIVEVIDTPNKKTFVQKAFYFLYSYLIFTGTTKVMATMGTRPDEPPAGGKWYLAPFKIGIAKTIGRSRWIKRSLVPRLWLRIFTGRSFAALFDYYQPDVVFVPHLYGWFDTVLLGEAVHRSILTIGMPAGWDHLDKYFLPLHVERLLVASEQVKRMAVEYQAYDSAKILTVGYPHFDFIVRRDFLTSREELLPRLGFPADSKFLLYVSGSAYCPDEPDIIETILKWADEGKFGCDVRLVIRPYLGGRGKDKAFDTEKFQRFAEHPRVSFYKKEFWGDLDKSFEFMNMLAHADAVVALYTTMVVEAAVLDRPLVAPAFDGYHTRPYRRSIRRFMEFDHFREVIETGALKIVYNFEELFSVLDAYIRDPQLDAERREALRTKICGMLDGGASRRILAEVLSEK